MFFHQDCRLIWKAEFFAFLSSFILYFSFWDTSVFYFSFIIAIIY